MDNLKKKIIFPNFVDIFEFSHATFLFKIDDFYTKNDKCGNILQVKERYDVSEGNMKYYTGNFLLWIVRKNCP
jgi:hypothetical protein